MNIHNNPKIDKEKNEMIGMILYLNMLLACSQ